MILSQTAEHALRAILYVARHGGTQPVRVNDAAQALEIPRNYLSKILHNLARAGILSSSRGKAGGFRLGKAADRLSLWAVVEKFDRMPAQRRCLLGRPVCSDRTPCVAHATWKTTAESINAFFRETTVADLLRNAPPDSQL